MTQILGSIFDGAVFRPERQVQIEPNTRVRLIVKIEAPLDRTVGDVAGHLFGAIEANDAPTEVSTDKDYLLGYRRNSNQPIPTIMPE